MQPAPADGYRCVDQKSQESCMNTHHLSVAAGRKAGGDCQPHQNTNERWF